MKNKIIIYTDGACSGNPGPGGWGAILIYIDNEKYLSGSDKMTTIPVSWVAHLRPCDLRTGQFRDTVATIIWLFCNEIVDNEVNA